MAEEEEVRVCWGGFCAQEGAGAVEGGRGLVHDLVGEVVEDGGLVGLS